MYVHCLMKKIYRMFFNLICIANLSKLHINVILNMKYNLKRLNLIYFLKSCTVIFSHLKQKF